MLMSAVKRGAFILLEGVDRCGKTTQARMLVERLRADGISCEAMRFPDRTTTIGQMINSYLTNESDLDDRVIHLLFSANRWEAVARMRTLLEGGTSIVVDRYAFSGVAFTAAKPGMDIQWCMQPDVGLPRPDAVIFLDLSVEESMRRGAFGAERYEREDMQRRVRDNFLRMRDEDWVVVDARQSVEDIHRQLEEVAKKTITAVTGTPIGKLWVDETKASRVKVVDAEGGVRS